MLRESSSIRHHPAYLLPVHSWQQTMPTVLWHVQKNARSLEQHSESSHSELRKTIQDMHCRCQGRFLHQKCIRLNNQETESHSLSGGGTLNLGLQKPKVGDQQLGLSRNNLPPQKKTHTHTHTTTKTTAKASSPAKSGNVPRMQCRPVVLHCRTVRPNPHTMLIPNRPRLQLPQYRTNTALLQNMRPPKDPSERTKKSGKQKYTRTKGFFLSTMLCLDYDYYYYYDDDDIIAEKDVLRFIDQKKKT